MTVYSLTVPNKVGSYDGDMVVKQYSSLTISSGNTLTVDQPCRGLLIYVQGDCTINGTLSMKSRGAYADPTASGGSDSHAVSSSGLIFPFKTSSGTDTVSSSSALLNGCGTSARTIIANHPSLSGNGNAITISRQGALGGGGGSGGYQFAMGSVGANGNTGQSGGGGGGRGGYSDYSGSGGSGGGGSYGSCFAGGSGGGNGQYNNGNGGAATAWAGPGGNGGGNGGNYFASGGIGNPNGSNSGNSSQFATYDQGTGGLIVLIVGGNLTIGNTGKITAEGIQSYAPTTSTDANQGASGGGNIIVAYKGTYTNNGTITAAGGASSDTGRPSRTQVGGGGGNGSVQVLQIS